MTRPSYPETPARPEPVSAGGISFDDPYLWLEEDSPDALVWQERQNALAEERLRAWSGFDGLSASIEPHSASLFELAPKRAGGRWFQVTPSRTGVALTVSTEIGGPAAVLLDTGKPPRPGPVSLDCVYPSPDGLHVVFGLSRGGDEQTVLGVVETESGRVLADQLEFASFAGVAWLPDSNGFYHNAGIAPDTELAQKWIFLHLLGSTLEPEPQPIQTRREYACPQISSDGRYVAAISTETEPRPEFVMDRERGEWQPFLRDVPGVFVGDFVGSSFVAITDAGAPRGRVVSIPLDRGADPSSWTELVPESEAVLRSLSVAGDSLVLCEFLDGTSRIKFGTLDGRLVEEIPLPGVGAVSTSSGWGHAPLVPIVAFGEGELTFVYSSPTSAPCSFRYTLATHSLEQVSAPRCELDGAVVRRIACRSADGTSIPCWLVHRRDLSLSRPRPTLIYGYGGWNIAFLPAYVGELAAFVEAGGIVVLPNLRGGAEYGRAWWEGGRLANKQNTFDDLFTIAETLIAAGVTSSDRLAVAGASNGGLLAAAAAVQRPELFRAAVPLVPLTDMLRFPRDAYGREMSEDYGDPDDPAAARGLFGYSPYHNVRDGTRYPAMLVVCAANDIRCPPWNGRKLVARLQGATSGDAPILLRVWPDAGHLSALGGDPRRTAEWLGFVMAELGMTP